MSYYNRRLDDIRWIKIILKKITTNTQDYQFSKIALELKNIGKTFFFRKKNLQKKFNIFFFEKKNLSRKSIKHCLTGLKMN